MSAERFFLDTAFVLAILNRRDQFHPPAGAFLSRMRTAAEVWITEAVTSDSHFQQAGYRALLFEQS